MSDFEDAWRKALSREHKALTRILMFGPTPEEEARWAEKKRIDKIVNELRPKYGNSEDSWRAGYEAYDRIYGDRQ